LAQVKVCSTAWIRPRSSISIVTNADKTTNKEINPAYTSWVTRDQAVLGYLLSPLTRETLLHVLRCTTAEQAWSTLANLYSSQTRTRSVNTQIVLATTKKNNLSISDYYSKLCQFADDLTASGAPLHDDELVAYLLAGLNEAYNPVFTSVVARSDPIAPSELYAQLLSFEQHTNLQGATSHGGSLSAMAASRGCGYTGGRAWLKQLLLGQWSWSWSRTRQLLQHLWPQQRRLQHQFFIPPQCQLCSKVGHTAKKCWYRYEDNSALEQRSAAFASSGADPAWYTDSGATDYITGDLGKLTMHDPYVGNDQIHAANGSGMNITRVGNSIIPIITHNLVLNNVVHVPSSHKNKLVFSVIKIFFAQWHMHLGHPSQDIVRRVILKNNLTCSHFGSSKDSVCDACACAKAHQLPYSVSSSHSSAPLELIYSDVWGPAIDSFGHKKYYVSFIDDYSKFNWIYLLRHKSEVSKYFFEFQKLVEHMLDRKIITVQLGRGV
jgi:hypothetical protein